MVQFQVGARDPLFFMHIPKTAGMSMRLYLSEQYPPQVICPVSRWQELLGREQDVASFRLVQGHFRYNVRELLSVNARTLVMLREPLRRTVSALQHLKRDPNFHQDYHLAKALTLPEMIHHSDLMESQRNVQARYLCASIPAAEVSAYLARELARHPSSDAGDREDPPDVHLATARLASIDFVGLTENIGSLVTELARTMNFHPPLYFPVINDDPARVDPLEGLGAEEIAILREYNDIDLALYAFGQRLIERRSFEQDMAHLVRCGVYQVPSGSFEIPIDGIMPGSGWYGPDTENGVSWRWTGPDRHFTIELPLRQNASYRLILTFGGDQPPGPGDLTAEVNDVPVNFEPSFDGDCFRRELPIPRWLLIRGAGYCRIKFETREQSRPANQDLRALGVSIRQVVFQCLE